jgi:hypothetical protein
VSYIVAILFLTLTILLAVSITVLIKTLSSSEIFKSMFANEITTLRNILIAFCSSYSLRLVLDLTLAPIWLKQYKNDQSLNQEAYYYKLSMYQILSAYVYDFIPILCIQLYHIRNFHVSNASGIN